MTNNGNGPVALCNSLPKGNIAAHKKVPGIKNVESAGRIDNFNLRDNL